jgi:hypothetical protein
MSNPRANGAERRSGRKPGARVLIPPGYLHPGKRNLDNLTFNFNSLLGIVYVSFKFSMQFPTVEECDFEECDFEYVAISHRYDLKT